MTLFVCPLTLGHSNICRLNGTVWCDVYMVVGVRLGWGVGWRARSGWWGINQIGNHSHYQSRECGPVPSQTPETCLLLVRQFALPLPRGDSNALTHLLRNPGETSWSSAGFDILGRKSLPQVVTFISR